MIKLTFNLTVDETNTILAALSTRPYCEVADLIAKIKAEGDAQFWESQEKKQSEE